MVKRRVRNRVNATGRNNTTRFARLDHRLLNSAAYRSLSPNARALLVELTMLHNGENNGSLYLGVRDGAHRMGVADLTAASNAFEELARMGFTEMTQDAYFHVKTSEKSRARCWRLTWLAGPGRKAPSWDFEDRQPEPQSIPYKRMERGLRTLKAYRKARAGGKLPVLDCDTLTPFPPKMTATAVSNFNTPKHETGGFQPIRIIRDSATHPATPWDNGARCNILGWWQPDCTMLIAKLAFLACITGIQPTPTPAGAR